MPYWTMATTGTRWTKTTVDGFGRTMTSESGYNTGVTPTSVSLVDTKYAPCACTPVGKLWKTSLPYAPGTAEGSKLWVEHYYDALGRTVEVRQPSAAGSTTYEYTGVVVKVIDPKGKWKKFTNDALGNLVNVQEPQPGGGTAYETNYTYSELGQLLTVTMVRPGKGAGAPATVTQTRTWVYDGNQRLSTVVHPESGTTAKPSATYAYNPDGTVLWKMDSKEQKIGYTYDSDGRVTVAKRYFAGGGEDTCAKVEYFYNSQSYDATFSQNATGRLAATATGCTYVGAGQLIEMYSYNAAGAVVKKWLRIVRGSGTVDKDVTYTSGSDGKLATVLYPGTTVPYTYSYDLMDRPVKMTGSPTLLGNTTVDLVKDVAFGVAGQVTSMKYMQWQDSGTPYYFTETKTYNSLFQMTRQETVGSGGTAADIEYGYTAPSSTLNDGRIYSRKNNLRNSPSGESVVYTYDELNRVTLASSSAGWAQSFDYDGFGNLWTAGMSGGGSATPLNVTFSQTSSTNRINTSGWTYDLNGNTLTMPVPGGSASMTYDIDNRLKTWTGSPGVEEYGYLADNKRVWKKAPSGTETVYLYGVGGQKLLTYTVQSSPFALISPVENVYFGGKLIRANGVAVVHDRLGSVVARVGSSDAPAFTKHDYLPYGEEMDSATGGNVDKFGTYLRDQTTGLDYADQRYFSSALGGRFLTADPVGSGLNHYVYVGGDPVNFADPSGLQEISGGGYFTVTGTATVVYQWCESLSRIDRSDACPDANSDPIFWLSSSGPIGRVFPWCVLCQPANFNGGAASTVTSAFGPLCFEGTQECVTVGTDPIDLESPPDLSWIGRNCPSGQFVNALGFCDVALGALGQSLPLAGQMLGVISVGAFGYIDLGVPKAIDGTILEENHLWVQPAIIGSYDSHGGLDISGLASVGGGGWGIELPLLAKPSPIVLYPITDYTGLVYQPCGSVGIYVGGNVLGGGFYLNLGCH